MPTTTVMPNWCSNRLVVEGDPLSLVEFMVFVRSRDDDGGELLLDFERIKPPPRGLDGGELISWRVENWGTKCNLNPKWTYEEPDSDPTRYVVRFTTAWSPPIPIVPTLAEHLPHLAFELEFTEPGNDVEGYLRFRDGELVEEEYGETEVA